MDVCVVLQSVSQLAIYGCTILHHFLPALALCFLLQGDEWIGLPYQQSDLFLYVPKCRRIPFIPKIVMVILPPGFLLSVRLQALIRVHHMPRAWWLIRCNLLIIISVFRLLLHIASHIECMTLESICDSLQVREGVLGMMFFLERIELRIHTLFELEHKLLHSFRSELVTAWWATYLSLPGRMTAWKSVCFTLLEFGHFSGQALDKASKGFNIDCFLFSTLVHHSLGLQAHILGVILRFSIHDDSNCMQVFLNIDSLFTIFQ